MYEKLLSGLPPLSCFQKIRNQEVDGQLGAESVYYSYQLFEYGKNREGYWDADKMLIQTMEVISAFEYKFPGKTLVFLFDWSYGHDKKPADAAVLGKINVKWGGKQNLMRDTYVLEDFTPPTPGGASLKKGDKQCLVFQQGDAPPFNDPNAVNYVGCAKGLAQIAYERGIWRPRMVKCDETNTERSLVHVLGQCLDFQQEVMSILKEEITKLEHICDFLPKFHCELNPIERVWAKSKRYIRAWSDQTTPTLKKLVPKSFLPHINLPVATIKKYFHKSEEYAIRYLQGDSLLLAQMSIKTNHIERLLLRKLCLRDFKF